MVGNSCHSYDVLFRSFLGNSRSRAVNSNPKENLPPAVDFKLPTLVSLLMQAMNSNSGQDIWSTLTRGRTYKGFELELWREYLLQTYKG